MRLSGTIVAVAIASAAVSIRPAWPSSPIKTVLEIVQERMAQVQGQYSDHRYLGYSEKTANYWDNLDGIAHHRRDEIARGCSDNLNALKNQALSQLANALTEYLPTSAKPTDYFSATGEFTKTEPFGGWTVGAYCRGKLSLQLTPHGRQYFKSGFLLASADGSTVDGNARNISLALRKIKLLPGQRKVLSGFYNASRTFLQSLQAEDAKRVKGEKFKPAMHRDFVKQAGLVIAYYRYLQESLEEAAQLSSEEEGVEQINLDSVEALKRAVNNLVEAYGLDGDVASRQAADYGRVMVDLLVQQLNPLIEEDKKNQLIKPIVAQLGRIISLSEAQGDTVVKEEVIKLRDLWEHHEFKEFMTSRLSMTDEKINGLILNLNSLAYRIGSVTNVSIRVLTQDDVEIAKEARQAAKRGPRKQ